MPERIFEAKEHMKKKKKTADDNKLKKHFPARKEKELTRPFIWKSPPQFENRIMYGALRVVLCTKKLHFVSRNWRMEN